MSTAKTTTCGVAFTGRAIEHIAETGLTNDDVAQDIADLRNGAVSAERFTDARLRGADADDVLAILDYCNAVIAAAGGGLT